MIINYYPDLISRRGATEETVPWLTRCVLEDVREHTPSWFTSLKGRNNISMCPSFRNTFSTGFVMKMPVDFMVTRLENDQIEMLPFSSDIMNDVDIRVYDVHEQNQFGPNFPFPEGFTRISVKILAHHVIFSNEEFDMVIQPCWWHDSYQYIQAQHGMIRYTKNAIPISYNVNTYIRVPENPGDHYTIVAGTPIAHLFFCNIRTPKLEETKNFFVSKKAKQKLWERALIISSKFSGEYFSFLKNSLIKRGKKD